jgi:hypothetical protein
MKRKWPATEATGQSITENNVVLIQSLSAAIRQNAAAMRLPDLREQITTMQAHKKGGKLGRNSSPPLSNRSQRDWGVGGERPIDSINLA